MAVRRILVVADSGPAAVATAAAVAQRSGASLRLVAARPRAHAAESHEPVGLLEAGAGELEGLAQPLRAAGLDVSTAARDAPTADALLDEAADFGADLLVHGTARGRRFADADWRIVRDAPCPVLFTQGAPPSGYRQALAAVDPLHAHDKPAALDDALVGAAQALVDPAGGQLHLLHCHLPPQYVPMRAPGAGARGALHPEDRPLEVLRLALQQLAQRHGIAADNVYLEPGDAREGILDMAGRLGADLVVMGAVSRSRLKRLLIGSTTEAVLDRLPCDVLAVKPPGR